MFVRRVVTQDESDDGPHGDSESTGSESSRSSEPVTSRRSMSVSMPAAQIAPALQQPRPMALRSVGLARRQLVVAPVRRSSTVSRHPAHSQQLSDAISARGRGRGGMNLRSRGHGKAAAVIIGKRGRTLKLQADVAESTKTAAERRKFLRSVTRRVINSDKQRYFDKFYLHVLEDAERAVMREEM